MTKKLKVEIRCTAEEKADWEGAAKRSGEALSKWTREVLNVAASAVELTADSYAPLGVAGGKVYVPKAKTIPLQDKEVKSDPPSIVAPKNFNGLPSSQAPRNAKQGAVKEWLASRKQKAPTPGLCLRCQKMEAHGEALPEECEFCKMLALPF